MMKTKGSIINVGVSEKKSDAPTFHFFGKK